MSNKNELAQDGTNQFIQAFVPDPTKVQATNESFTDTSTWTLAYGSSGGDVNNGSRWIAVNVRSDKDLIRYFNGETTKYRTIPANTDTIILLPLTWTTLTIKNSSGSTAQLEIEGM